ncbi:MAG: YcgL domain-containing protein [Xanthomonadales bacterium]|nr:YcgL domain-containing protein [Xanthomonadales bacterium]
MAACLVYRSDNMAETYLYLPLGTVFSDLPDALQLTFGEPSLVIRLDIKADMKLAQADPAQVLRAIDEQGYFLQLPPKLPVEELISRRFS